MVARLVEPIERVIGDEWAFAFTLTNTETSAPINLTASTVTGALRRDGGADIDATVANGRVVMTDAAAGKFAITFQETDTAGFAGARNVRVICAITTAGVKVTRAVLDIAAVQA
jgi:hypothetical protein